MADLRSPGVEVSINDESFYGTSGAGTVPLIIMATAANKTAASGVGYAPYTTPANNGKLFLATSQRELIQNFGSPYFHSVQGTQIHGHELNEYGLHAAYQYLGVSNRAFVLRADIDLAQLEASKSAPKGAPIAGQYWLDLSQTSWGVFKSNGNPIAGLAWEPKSVLVATDNNVTSAGDHFVPKATFGQNGQFAVVTKTSDNLVYEKVEGAWHAIGSTAWKAAHPTTIVGTVAGPAPVASGSSFTVNGKSVTVGDDGTLPTIRQLINDAAIPNVSASISGSRLILRNTAGGDLTIENRTLTPLLTLGLPTGTKRGVAVSRTADAQYPNGSIVGDLWVKGTQPNNGAKWTVKIYDATAAQWTAIPAPFYAFDSLSPESDRLKDTAANAVVGLPMVGALYVGYDAATGVQMLRRYNGSSWEFLDYVASFDAPTEEPTDGTLWYNADFRTDIMVSDGNTWLGYKNNPAYRDTDPSGVILSASQPATQSDGTPLVDHDLWIDTSDLENYPKLARYDSSVRRWKLVDLTDQTTPFGIIFADARANSGPSFEGMQTHTPYAHDSEDSEAMLVSDFLDPDAPDPRKYPAGTLLFNTRYATYNVKVWRPNYLSYGVFDPNTDYEYEAYTIGDPNLVFPPVSNPGRWVSESGLKIDGSPYMGRKAQRACVVKAMSAAVIANEDLRSELAFFNLMAAPGYPELMDELVNLNTQQKEVSFIVGDTPSRLKPNGTDINAWAKNPNGYPNGEEGRSTANVYAAVYYPWGLGTNLDGAEIMIPPSTLALCTMAYNDSIAYPWYAPAGFQRGLVTAATTVGYLTSEGEFKPTLLNPGQRDTLYEAKINPIAFIPGRGLAVYGQKTLSPVASALDRINVARLANYLKYNLDNLMKQYLFEQNDQQTRDSVKLTVQRFLAGLVTLRALEDFAVLCDETNNTPERRDQNQLWVDILIKPIKAIEFIYVPVRIRNSSDSLQFA